MSRLVDKVTFGAARRRRRMARLLAQLDKLPADAMPTGPSGRGSYRPPRRRRLPGLRVIATLMVWVLIIGGVVYLARGAAGGHGGSPQSAPSALNLGSDANHSSQTARAANSSYPTAGFEEQKSRVLPAVATPAAAGPYKFLQMNGDKPVAYDPCRPIHYVIRDHGTPTWGDQMVRQAIAAVSKATGLKFVDDGMTGEAPSKKRPWLQRSRYGDRWAPVLIAWSDPTENAELTGPTVGLGGSQSFWYGQENAAHNYAYVTGTVWLDTPQMKDIATRPKGPGIDLAIMEHELGHLVGLAHVSDPTQIMNPETSDVLSYAAGDLQGLAQLGRGACHPEL